MLELGGVTLNSSMIWRNRHESQDVAQATRRLLGGGLVVTSRLLTGGNKIVLEATEDSGWLTLTQVQAVTAMSKQPGAVFVLNVEGETYNVLFDHEDQPAWSAEPLVHRLNEQPEDYYTAVLKLLVV